MVSRGDLHRGVGLAGGSASDQKRHVEPFASHLARHVNHFIERWRDQPAEADDIDLFVPRGFQDLLARHHHAKVDHFVVVAPEHHTHDIFADVVDVPLHRGHEDARSRRALAGGLLLRLHVGKKIRHRFLHDPGALDDLGQEHLAGPKQVADNAHACH